MGVDVLVVEDYAATLRQISHALSQAGYSVREAANGKEALEEIRSAAPQVVVSDYRMVPVNGLELLHEVRKSLDVPFILYSAGADSEAIFRAGREGAFVFLEYPFRIEDQLIPTIEESLARGQAPDSCRSGLSRLLGRSVAMHRVRSLVAKVAGTPSTVLVTGETGTGKELVVEAIHDESQRNPLVSVSVREIPESLLEAQLFGHAKGAFTGAISARAGLFEQASGGTLFLDEIGDAAPSLQATLLRALETREVRPVGDVRSRKVDVRIVAATHRNLAECVRTGSFREDLYYRIRQTEIFLPPLRDRLADLDSIVPALIDQAARELRVGAPQLDAGFIRALRRYSWPGNVRELRSLLYNVLLWWDGVSALDESNLLEAMNALNPGLPADELTSRNRMLDAYRQCGGNQEAARRELGLSRGEWRHRWARFGLDIFSRRRG